MRYSNRNPGFGSFFSAATAMILPAHEAITHQPLYGPAKSLHLSLGLGAVWQRAFSLLGTWQRRIDDRRALSSMDPHLLKDLGIEPYQARDEAAKPFWRRLIRAEE